LSEDSSWASPFLGADFWVQRLWVGLGVGAFLYCPSDGGIFDPSLPTRCGEAPPPPNFLAPSPFVGFSGCLWVWPDAGHQEVTETNQAPPASQATKAPPPQENPQRRIGTGFMETRPSAFHFAAEGEDEERHQELPHKSLNHRNQNTRHPTGLQQLQGWASSKG